MRKLVLVLIAVPLVVLVASWLALRSSLPILNGTIVVEGLAAPVDVERDGLGVPTLRASDRTGLAFATGFVHAQDRFFQMDLLRRAGAGRLAELLGAGVLETDKRLRIHGFEHVARAVIDQLPPEHHAILEAYAQGVNAAMAQWRVRPPEYLLLRVEPQPWSPIDSVLVVHAMFLDLNDSTGHRDIETARMRATLPAALVAFLEPPGTEWDAPIVGDAFEPVPIPGPEVIDLRAMQIAATNHATVAIEDRFDGVTVGSNNWAVGGAHTLSGTAILANDMHLGLRIPNVWYRARLIVASDDEGKSLDMTGVTLPGTPILVAGSNGHVAWGYTNSYGDWTDVVLIEPDPSDPDRYLTADGSQSYDMRVERIAAANVDTVADIEVRSTIWGPVIGELDGRPIALSWTAHRPRAANLRHLDLEHVETVADALAVANTIGAPVQNFVAADASGSIGWTLMGQVPIRTGYDPDVPSSWSQADTGWTGWREPREYPRIVNPAAGRIWTANARVLDLERLAFVGDGGYDRGARAGQIRDALLALEDASVADMARIQLDHRTVFLVRWQRLLLDLLAPDALTGEPHRQRVRDLVSAWSGRAAVDDVGYRIVRAFRLAVLNAVYASLVAPARASSPGVEFDPSPQFEGSLWQLVTERPAHLLDPSYASWSDALLGALDQVFGELEASCGRIEDCTWGERNRLTMGHPIGAALPILSRWLDMPAVSLPGDGDMPRVQSPQFGASERFAVSPGDEAQGYFQMPGGQSGHPLSPFYRAGHEAWVRGELSPFLPGSPQHALRLVADRPR